MCHTHYKIIILKYMENNILMEIINFKTFLPF